MNDERYRPRVLLVEDNDDVAEMMTTLLRTAGECDVFRAAGASDVDEAQLPAVDVLVLDLSLADSGVQQSLELAHRWRAVVPIVIVSGYVDELTLARHLGERRIPVIPKPPHPATVVSVVRDAAAPRGTERLLRAAAEKLRRAIELQNEAARYVERAVGGLGTEERDDAR